MLLPDLNLLIYAYDSGSGHHAAARAWWENVLSNSEPVGLSWLVLLGFIRLMTNPSLFRRPYTASQAVSFLRSWLERPQVRILQPGPRHLDLLEDLAHQAGVAGKLTTDLHLAALALENDAELHSNDGDFGRFSGLRWTNPLI